MKKIFCIVLAVALAGCTGQPQVKADIAVSEPVSKRRGLNGLKDAPVFVNKTYQTAANDVLVGVGAYNFGGDTSKIGMAKTRAEIRARTDISRQLLTIVKNMVTDYLASSSLDPQTALSFQEDISQLLSRSDLSDAKTIQWKADDDGVMWVTMRYDRTAAAAEINKAVGATIQKFPQAADFDVHDRMNTSFDKEAGGGPDPVID